MCSGVVLNKQCCAVIGKFGRYVDNIFLIHKLEIQIKVRIRLITGKTTPVTIGPTMVDQAVLTNAEWLLVILFRDKIVSGNKIW